jgi:hypothetical protein
MVAMLRSLEKRDSGEMVASHLSGGSKNDGDRAGPIPDTEQVVVFEVEAIGLARVQEGSLV